MGVFFESGYTLPGSDQPLTHARILHKGNRLRMKSVLASSTSLLSVSVVDNALTNERWKPFDNQVSNPSNFSETNWTLTGVSLGSDSNTLAETAVTSEHKISSPVTFTAVEWVAALRVDRQTAQEVQLSVTDSVTSSVFFDLRDGTVGASSNATGTITDLGDDEFLLKIYWVSQATTGTIELKMSNGSETISYLGKTSNTVKVLEMIAHPSAATIDLTPFGAVSSDTLGIAAHNIGRSQGRITLENNLVVAGDYSAYQSDTGETVDAVMVADYGRNIYTNEGATKEFADLHTVATTSTRTATLSNGFLGWAGHNIVLNSATLSTQGVTTAAADYTIAFTGTGTITLTGTSTAGPIVGTGVNDLVSLEVTATAGTLTLTVSGSVTLARVYRSDLGGMQTNDTSDPTYYETGANAYYAPAFDYDPVEIGTNRQMRIEPAATNLLLNSNALSTQNVTVSAVEQTIHFTGTGTITLTGTSTAGPIVGTGTGESNRVSLTFTPTAGTLTCTVSGTATNAQLEMGSVVTSYIPTASGTVTRTVDDVMMGPVLGGTELITNGEFLIDTSGWTPSGSTLSLASNQLRVTNTGAGFGLAFQSFTTVIGSSYTATLDFVAGTANGKFGIGTTATGEEIGATATDSTSPKTLTFVATTTTTWIDIVLQNAGAGTFADFDNITVQELVPFAGYDQDEGAISVEFDIGTGVPGTFPTILFFSDGAFTNFIYNFIVGSDGAGRIKFDDGSVTQAEIDAGTSNFGVSNKMASAWAVNDFSASLNGAAVVVDGSGTIPSGITELNIGSQLGSSEFMNGRIKSIVYYPKRLTNTALVNIGNDITTSILPIDNEPIMLISEPRTSPSWRVTVDRTVLPEIGVVRIGKSLQMTRPIFGGHEPLALSRKTTMRSNKSTTGEWLGRTKLRTSLATKFAWSNIESAWVRDNWPQFQKAAEDEPFFMAWRPITYSEAGYCSINQNVSPSNLGVRKLMGLSLNVTGFLNV